MMDLRLPEELLRTLVDSIPCRELQIRQLSDLLCSDFPAPSLLLVHGVEATGKTLTVTSVLQAFDVPTAFVFSQECITTRHLLERAIAAVKEALVKEFEYEVPNGLDGRCESISAFVVELQRLLEGKEKIILVFDGVDRQREAAPTLLPAIARLGEIIPNLSVVLVCTVVRPHHLHHAGVPHLHFPPYTRAESLSITSKSPLSIHPSSQDDPTSEYPASLPPNNDEDSTWLWSRFTTAVWDSLGQGAARDIVSFRGVCERLWTPFIQPILDGHYGAREFSKLMVKNRTLFQSETALIDSIIPITPAPPSSKPTKHPPPQILPYYPSHLLISAYLASHNPPKTDLPLLSKSSLSKKRKPRRTANPRNLSRKLLGPQAFPLERLLAIFHAILPHAYGGGGADLMCQLATLAGLRLVVRVGGGGDVLEGGGGKWKVNVGWEYVRGVAGGVGFDVEGFLVE